MLDLKYNSDGLIPAVITDYLTGEVLTLAYMSAESLEITLREGYTCFYSRSRKTLWRKGETSGNTQKIVSIKTDCDRDTLLIRVKKSGPACHTGAESCFNDELYLDADAAADTFSLHRLYDLICHRRDEPKPGSYTNYLFDKGLDKILKKIGEESTEVIIAAKAQDEAETVYEIADLTYHLLVLMASQNISTDAVLRELESRHVIDTKIKQERPK